VQLAGPAFDLTGLTALWPDTAAPLSVISSAGVVASLTIAGVHTFSGAA
jgi:hypothetical protein